MAVVVDFPAGVAQHSERRRSTSEAAGSNPAPRSTEPTCLSELYGQQIDLHLPKLSSDQARWLFLKEKHADWTRQYADFIRTEGASHRPHPVFGQPKTWDFANTLCEIEIRMAKYEVRT